MTVVGWVRQECSLVKNIRWLAVIAALIIVAPSLADARAGRNRADRETRGAEHDAATAGAATGNHDRCERRAAIRRVHGAPPVPLRLDGRHARCWLARYDVWRRLWRRCRHPWIARAGSADRRGGLPGRPAVPRLERRARPAGKSGLHLCLRCLSRDD